MNIKLEHLKFLISQLKRKDVPLGMSLERRYARELSGHDDDARIRLKEVADNERILVAGNNLGLDPTQRQAAGLDNMEVWTSTPPNTQIPMPVPDPQQRKIITPGKEESDIRIAVPQALCRLYPDFSKLSLSYCYQNLVATGCVAGLTIDQFAMAVAEFSAFEYHQEQLINLELPDMEEERLRDYIRKVPSRDDYDDDAKGKHLIIKTITSGQALDIQTAKFFLAFIVHSFSPRNHFMIRADLDFIEGASPGYCGSDSMSAITQNGELLVPVFETAHWLLVTINYATQEIKLYDSIPRRTCALLFRRVRDHYNVPTSFTTRIVKCPIQQDFRSNGLFMLFNAIAHLGGFDEPHELYNGDTDHLQDMRNWLALAFLRNEVPRNYDFDDS